MSKMTTIKAIETSYKGYRFRSRLEARWAVFLDALGWKWEYEVEGFEVKKGIYYLPDFFLPESETFLEIKPAKPNTIDLTKIKLLAGHLDVVLAVGAPDAISYRLYGYSLDAHAVEDLSVLFMWHKGEIGNWSQTWDEPGTRHDEWLGQKYANAVRAARSERFDGRSLAAHPALLSILK